MKIANLLPFEKYTLITHLSMAEARERMNRIVGPRKSLGIWWNTRQTQPYEGEVHASAFRIRRVIRYRNSFLPVIRGEMYPYMGRTLINLSMRPILFVLIFMGFWMGTIGLICLGELVAFLYMRGRDIKHIHPMAFIPFGMFFFGWVLCTGAFKAESKKSKKFLSELLEGEVHDIDRI